MQCTSTYLSPTCASRSTAATLVKSAQFLQRVHLSNPASEKIVRTKLFVILRQQIRQSCFISQHTKFTFSCSLEYFRSLRNTLCSISSTSRSRILSEASGNCWDDFAQSTLGLSSSSSLTCLRQKFSCKNALETDCHAVLYDGSKLKFLYSSKTGNNNSPLTKRGKTQWLPAVLRERAGSSVLHCGEARRSSREFQAATTTYLVFTLLHYKREQGLQKLTSSAKLWTDDANTLDWNLSVIKLTNLGRRARIHWKYKFQARLLLFFESSVTLVIQE